MPIDYNDLILRYDKLIKKFAAQYYKGVMPKEDYEQELRIRLWRKIGSYNSALGTINNYAYGILNLETKKIKSDMKMQDRFEENIILGTAFSFIDCCENNNYELFIDDINNILGDNEKKVFDLIVVNLDNSVSVRHKKLASSVGITIYDLNKTLFNIKNKIRIFIDNREFF